MNKKKLIKFTRIFAIASSTLMLGLFLTFFIGEKISLATIKGTDMILLILIPGLLSISTIIAWFKELIGGIMMASVIVLFNIISIIIYKRFTFDFWLFLIIAILFISVGLLKKKLYI